MDPATAELNGERMAQWLLLVQLWAAALRMDPAPSHAFERVSSTLLDHINDAPMSPALEGVDREYLELVRLHAITSLEGFFDGLRDCLVATGHMAAPVERP